MFTFKKDMMYMVANLQSFVMRESNLLRKGSFLAKHPPYFKMMDILLLLMKAKL